MKESDMSVLKEKWLELIGRPDDYDHPHSLTLLKKYDHPEFDGELYLQANGPGTFQRVFMVFPKGITAPVPAVAVPFYYPEAMLGFDPETGETLPGFKNIEMLLHLVRRGYAATTADSYHLTYLRSDKDRSDFTRWQDAGEALLRDQPGWTGIGKLIYDTKLMTDVLAADPRVDENRLAIAGHSLGGKMAFYAGCLDDRYKAILASDFGIGWDQTNWRDIWYWGEKVDGLKVEGIDHASLLGAAAPKPFCLLAGLYDNEDSRAMMQAAPGYEGYEDRLVILNHATGHRPPMDVLEEGYRFLDKWI